MIKPQPLCNISQSVVPHSCIGFLINLQKLSLYKKNNFFNLGIKMSSFCFLFIYTIHTQAQKDSTKLQLNQVEVIKAFEAVLEDAQKVSTQAVIPATAPFTPTYQYDITIVPIELKYTDPEIKPLAAESDPPFKVNQAYLFAGYGLRKNPDITAGYHFSKKDTYAAGIHAHYSALDNSQDFPLQKYQNGNIDLYGHYLVKENMKLYGSVKANFMKRYFYHTALPVDSLYTEEESSRSINGLQLTAGISNVEATASNINYDLQMSLRQWNISNTDLRESGVGIKASVEKLMKSATRLSLDVQFDHTSNNGVKALDLQSASLLPALKTNIGPLKLEAGINMAMISDGNTSFFPHLFLSYGISGQKLQIFAGTDQNVYVQNMNQIIRRNPYLSSSLDTLRNALTRDIFGGVKGQFSFLNYQIKAGYKDVGRHMFLLNDSTDIRKFNMVFDDINIVYLSGNVDFHLSPSYSLGGWLTYNFIQTKAEKKPWHTSNLEANAYAKAMFLDSKLSIQSDLYIGSPVHFITVDDLVQKSNILFDLNVSAIYQVTEKIGLVARAINILDNRFERWYGYPSVGFNAMMMVKVVF